MRMTYSVYRVIYSPLIMQKISQNRVLIFNVSVSCIHHASKETVDSKETRTFKRKDYSATVHLPRTEFPLTQKAVQQRELILQATDGFHGLYNWQREQTDRPEFVLHDGPPYANGPAHVGHAMNKVLKDITNRYKLLTGHRIHYRPGWDCHGLPIEHRVLSNNINLLDSLSPSEIRSKAHDFARKSIRGQERSFRRWGVMADWDKPYLTMDREYEANQLEVFWHMYKEGLVYRHYMPVYWSPSSRSALAEAELEYNETHVSRAAYVRFPLTTLPHHLLTKIGDYYGTTYALIWTTTPWTLLANAAICFSPNIEYTISRCDGDVYITSSQFTANLSQVLGKTTEFIATISGADLTSCRYKNKLVKNDNLTFVAGNHVVPDKGTGLVHTAPAHGHDDFKVAVANKLPVECLVGEDGRFYCSSESPVAGKLAMGEGDTVVLEALGEDVVHNEDYTHHYPYDWRTKQPVIIRASKQWFINTSLLLHPSRECMLDVKVYPTNADWKRILINMLESRSYWCISRQRSWGVPIPVFYDPVNDMPIINENIVSHVASLVRHNGCGCWWTLSNAQLLPSEKTQLDMSDVDDLQKGTDIFDIWFDSGVSWASILPERTKSADLYMEGVDQLGGWFQTSLLTSVAVNCISPYKRVVIHGFAMDESGRKMSKSAGNVVDPATITDGGSKAEPAYGADTLRWWVAVSGLNSNVYIGPNIIERCNNTIYASWLRECGDELMIAEFQLADYKLSHVARADRMGGVAILPRLSFAIRKILRFLLGNLADFVDSHDLLRYDDLLPQDQYMLHLLHEFLTEVSDNYEHFEYSWAALSLEKLVNSHLSNFYCNIVKDRLYCEKVDCVKRRSCQTVLCHVLNAITVSMAPILPHLAEEAYSYSIHKGYREGMLFHTSWQYPNPVWYNPSLYQTFTHITDIRDEINATLVTRPAASYHVLIQCEPSLHRQLSNLQVQETDCSSPISEILQTAWTTILDKPIFEPVNTDITVDTAKIQDCLNITLRECHHFLCMRCRRHTAPTECALCDRCTSVIHH